MSRTCLLLARASSYWKQALLIVQPDTLLRWHRELFRIIWRRKKYINRKGSPSPSGQTWTTFLINHAPQIWARDFTQVYDIFFRALFIFVIIEHATRRIAHVAVTANPSDAWVAQQLREATPWGQVPKYLIRDNDSKYGHHFSAIAAGTGLKEIRTPIGAPNANEFCERFFGSLRHECLDPVLALNERHLQEVTWESMDYYHQARPHQGLGQCMPIPSAAERSQTGEVVAFPVLGGLHHDYRRAA